MIPEPALVTGRTGSGTRWRSTARIVLAALAGLPVAVSTYLYLAQERILFPRQPMQPAMLEWANNRFGTDEVTIPAADGTHLRGWLLPAAKEGPAPLLIYFGGNAEEVSGQIFDRNRFPEWSLLLVNYRGYGLSEGEPSQKALLDDAETLYDWAIKRPEIDKRKIVAWGRSLGTGVAVHLAAQRPLAGVLLISPYDSITAVATEHYPYAPVSWLLRHPFDSLSLAASIHTPMLALAVAGDEVVPVEHSERLVAAWGGPKALVVFQHGRHNDMEEDGNDYWERISAFLERIAQPQTASGEGI